MLDNLVKNAIEANRSRPGEVCLAISPNVSPSPQRQLSPSLAHRSVRDSGSGIPETVDVFRRFETTKYNRIGTGCQLRGESRRLTAVA